MALRARIGLILLAICGGVLGWELLVGTGLTILAPDMSEFWLYGVDKLGFALALAGFLTYRRLWQRCGFAGGFQANAAHLLWPLWLIAGISALQGFADDDGGRIVGWFAISAAVGFGEEGVFRGLIIAVLGADRPRRAVLISSILFGTLHLAGLLAPVDYRYILMQAVAAACLGLVLGSARLLTGSIWPGITAHTALDFFGLAAAGGVMSAADFSLGSAIVVLGSALVSFIWGIALWQRLPPD
ncbi:MAG: CPBP family intramembrane glutamic endopeptidase [Aliidongia sp.]